jgi:hypothetical protein
MLMSLAEIDFNKTSALLKGNKANLGYAHSLVLKFSEACLFSRPA